MPPSLQIENLSFSYPGQQPVFARFNLTLNPGDRLFVSGSSGCGKSTLLSLCAGMLTPDSGSVACSGQILERLAASQRDRLRADAMGFLFQAFNLVPYLSALDNVLLPIRISPIRRMRVAESANTPDAEAKRLLQAMDLGPVHFDKTASQLSLGQQQRVAAARALIGGPAVIFADEPTSALDPGNAERLLDLLLSECHKNATALLFVSHHRELGKFFDKNLSLSEPGKGIA